MKEHGPNSGTTVTRGRGKAGLAGRSLAPVAGCVHKPGLTALAASQPGSPVARAVSLSLFLTKGDK